MRYVYLINAVFIAVWAVIVYLTQPTHLQTSPNWWIDVLILGGFAMLQLQAMIKLKTLYGFSLVLSYTVALIVGLRIMLSLSSILSLAGFALFLLSLFAIIYLIGLRGFLRSDKGREIMKQEIMKQG
ncbi:MAG: hypothetical protein HWE13_01870 [Gammaproteobacteria bacterium]|nr:hypothetical protein [Gammaproteobacteria bacterium]